MPLTVRYHFYRLGVDSDYYRVAFERCSKDGRPLPNGRIGFAYVNRKDRNAYNRNRNPTDPQRMYYAIRQIIRYENRVQGFQRELDNYGIIAGFRRVDFRKDDAAVEACRRSKFDMSVMYRPE